MHFDEIAAKDSQFGKRIAHGYFVLSAAAGLFVSPGAGPGAGQLRPGQPALHHPGGHRRHHPGAPDLQAQIDQGKKSPLGLGNSTIVERTGAAPRSDARRASTGAVDMGA